MSNNKQHFKERVAPHDYLNGPVKVFTKEEIAEWEARSYPELDRKLEAQHNLSKAEIIALDAEALGRAEMIYADLMAGVSNDTKESDSR